jgi:hypothetical protein
MTNQHPTLAAIREWLKEKLSASRVDVWESDDSETHIFQVQPSSGRVPEFETSQEVIEDRSRDAILSELQQSDTVERMVRDPSVRVQFFSGGINHFETRYIRCDGRRYRIVRDEHHHVAIFDASDNRLRNTPRQVLNLPVSIFQKHTSKWCEDVRNWRGEDQ